jgi:hypothetical protein
MDKLSKTGNVEVPGDDNSDSDDDDDSTSVLTVTKYVTELKESDLVGKWVRELNQEEEFKEDRRALKCLKWGCEDHRNLRIDGRQRLAYPMEASLPLTYPPYVKVHEATDVEMSVDNGAEIASHDISPLESDHRLATQMEAVVMTLDNHDIPHQLVGTALADGQATSDSQTVHKVSESSAKSDRVVPQSVIMTSDTPDAHVKAVVVDTTGSSGPDAQPVQQSIEEEEIDYEVDELVMDVSATELVQLRQISNEVERAQEQAQARSFLDERKQLYGFKWVASQESLVRVMSWDYQVAGDKGTVATVNRFLQSGAKAFETLRNIQKDLTDFAYKLDGEDDMKRHGQSVFAHWVEVLSSFRFGIFYAIGKLVHHSCFNFHVNYKPANSYSLDHEKWTNWLENLARTRRQGRQALDE